MNEQSQLLHNGNMQGHSLFRKDTNAAHQKHHGLPCKKKKKRIHGADKINYVSQVKMLGKGLKEKYNLLDSFFMLSFGWRSVLQCKF